MNARAQMERDIKASGTKVEIERPSSGKPTTDPATGDVTYPDPVAVYSGPALISRVRQTAVTTERGDEQEYRVRYQVSLPITSPAVHKGDVVRVTQSRDPELAGADLRAAEAFGGSLVIRRRFVAEKAAVAAR